MVLGGPYGIPVHRPEMLLPSALAIWHPIPPTPRPYGLPPYMSESSGTRASSASGVFPALWFSCRSSGLGTTKFQKVRQVGRVR
jgi:hypothetical protein